MLPPYVRAAQQWFNAPVLDCVRMVTTLVRTPFVLVVVVSCQNVTEDDVTRMVDTEVARQLESIELIQGPQGVPGSQGPRGEQGIPGTPADDVLADIGQLLASLRSDLNREIDQKVQDEVAAEIGVLSREIRNGAIDEIFVGIEALCEDILSTWAFDHCLDVEDIKTDLQGLELELWEVESKLYRVEQDLNSLCKVIKEGEASSIVSFSESSRLPC